MKKKLFHRIIRRMALYYQRSEETLLKESLGFYGENVHIRCEHWTGLRYRGWRGRDKGCSKSLRLCGQSWTYSKTI